MFDGGDGGMEFARDGGQRRQIHVDGDGGEDRQRPEQEDQFEAARRGQGNGRGSRHESLRAAPVLLASRRRAPAPLTCRRHGRITESRGVSRPSNG